MDDQRERDTGQQTTGVGVGQFKNWIGGAPPEHALEVATLAIKRVASFDMTYRDRFLAEIGKDPAVARLLEDLKTPA